MCVSIPKGRSDISDIITRSFKIQDKIKDELFDILIIELSDLEEIYSVLRRETLPIVLSPCYYTTDGSEVFSTPYLSVRLKKAEDINLLSSYIERHSLRIIKQNQFLPLWYQLSITNNTQRDAIEIANLLWESKLFAASVPDLCYENYTCSNDPLFNLQWGLYNNNNEGIDISICDAWNYATGKDVKLAIIDDGIDTSHIDLASNVCNYSYDTETNTSPSVLYGDHGTHCAGIAAAVMDNNIQIAGVAPKATIIPVSNTLSATTFSPFKMSNGIVWAYQHGADIISNSWHSPVYHEVIDEAINDAFKYGRNGKGCIIVFATGNYGNDSINYPANCNDTILAVGAIMRNGIRADYSNYGTGLDVVAPGDMILSTYPNNLVRYNSGTSMACPHVSGVAALVLERNSELTVNQVNSIICSNAKKLTGVDFNISGPDGIWNTEYGYGLVDAYSAVINTPSTIYIQNDTIVGTRMYSADSIYIGHDVTEVKPYGSVTLGQGDITFKAKYITIKNSTLIPPGTTLKFDK